MNRNVIYVEFDEHNELSAESVARLCDEVERRMKWRGQRLVLNVQWSEERS